MCTRMYDATKGDTIVDIVIETERRKVMGCVTGAWKRGTHYKIVKLHGMDCGTKSRKKMIVATHMEPRMRLSLIAVNVRYL